MIRSRWLNPKMELYLHHAQNHVPHSVQEYPTLSSDRERRRLQRKLGTHLLLRHLLVLVDVQGIKQLCGAVSQPDEQVAGRHTLLQVHQFQLKHQHRTARHSSG